MTSEDLGKIVRQVWVSYCYETGKTDKPDHIAPWESLNEWGKEVDRRIGIVIANKVLDAALNICNEILNEPMLIHLRDRISMDFENLKTWESVELLDL